MSLLILEQHLQLCHSGVQQTMLSLHDRFWVPRSQQKIRQVIRTCPGCRIHQAVPFTQEAAPLPRERVCSGRPFSRIGVDLGGPIYAKDGNDTIKAYFVIFTCAVVRAVHLELVKGLSTDDFLQAFDRFVARRSSPETVSVTMQETFEAQRPISPTVVSSGNSMRPVPLGGVDFMSASCAQRRMRCGGHCTRACFHFSSCRLYYAELKV